MKDKTFYWILALVVVAIIVVAVIIIRNSNKNDETIITPPVVNNSNNNNGNNYIPPVVTNPPTPPPVNNSVIGKTVFAKEANVTVYYKSPFTIYKIAAYNEWLGIVKGDYGAYYVLDTGTSPDKIVNKTKVKF